MTPEQIATMGDLADTLSQTADAVQAANVELASIEKALKGHRASIETLFDREREIKAARDKLVAAMESAQAGLEAFETNLPEGALETATSVDEESGLAELVGRMQDDGGFPVEELETETTGLDPLMGVSDDDGQPGDAAEGMLHELKDVCGNDDGDVFVSKGDPDPEHAAPMQEAVDGLNEVSEAALQDLSDTCDEVIDACDEISDDDVAAVSDAPTADTIEAKAAAIAAQANGQIAK